MTQRDAYYTAVDRSTLLNTLKNNHKGKENAIGGRYLGFSHGATRTMVSQLRLEGHPICTCSKGYYYANTPEELAETIHYLEKLKSGMELTITSLERLWVDAKINGGVVDAR